MNANARLFAMITLIGLLAACGREEAARAPAGTDTEDAAASVAPPITPPGEAADPAEPPSYEVSIASAAADHNRALEHCAKQPESVRTQCQQEANTAFTEVQASLETLRGNQP